MGRVRRSGKRTLNEIAGSIISEGKMDNRHSRVHVRYYDAFGQRWKIIFNSVGNVKSIIQVRKDGTIVTFGGDT